MSRGRGNGNQPCTIERCEGGQVGQGLCDKHYRRWRRYGDPLFTKRIIGDDEARWWSHVERRGDDECWPWTGKPNDDGYGVFYGGAEGKVVGAHVWGYERFVEAVPPGNQLDHVRSNGCTMRNCVNFLRHLEPVTNRENTLRGEKTKLSDEYVAELLRRRQAGERLVDLCREADVHKTTLIRRFGTLSTQATG
jgi:hypothetical protein